MCFRARISTGVSCRGHAGLRSRRRDAWLWAMEIIHVCKIWSRADGFHHGVERGRIVRDMGCVSIAIVVGIPVVIGIVVVLLA